MQKLSPTECAKIVEHLQKTQPALVDDALEQIKKPEAEFNYFWQLLLVLNAFSEKKGFAPGYIIGTHIGNQATWERTLFIAICLKLYSPSVFKTNVSYDIRDNLREELAGMLGITTPNWISQQIDGIKVNMRAYDNFRDQVNEMVDYMKEVIQLKPVEEVKQISLLQ